MNLKGGFLVSKYVIPHLIEKKSGVIIYNSSVGGLRGFGRMSHYAASKHGLVGLTKSQAIELAPYGIRVVSLHPTGVNTPMNDGLAELEGTTPVEIAESKVHSKRQSKIYYGKSVCSGCRAFDKVIKKNV